MVMPRLYPVTAEDCRNIAALLNDVRTYPNLMAVETEKSIFRIINGYN